MADGVGERTHVVSLHTRWWYIRRAQAIQQVPGRLVGMRLLDREREQDVG